MNMAVGLPVFNSCGAMMVTVSGVFITRRQD